MRALALVAFLFLAADIHAQDVASSIRRGDLERAKKILKDVPQEKYSPVEKYLAGVVERDAKRSASLLRQALDQGLSGENAEDATLRLAHYYYFNRQWDNLRNITGRYLESYPRGLHSIAILRLRMVAIERAGNRQAAIKAIDNSLPKDKRHPARRWLLFDKARLQLETNRRDQAVRTLEELSDEKGTELSPIAVYLLSHDARDNNEPSIASQYAKYLAKSFPDAIGQDELNERLELGQGSPKDIPRHSEIYAVKLGVFSSRENARRHADKFRRSELPIDIENMIIGGKTRYVVFIGRFESRREADEVAALLEKRHREDYQVVTR